MFELNFFIIIVMKYLNMKISTLLHSKSFIIPQNEIRAPEG